MLDRSKSMQQGERIYKLLAILMNRLRAVGRREAILGYSFFDSQVHEQVMVKEVAEASEEIRKLHYDFFMGDDTDINLALREGIARIRHVVDDLEAERPELIIVTDGDHGINVKASELKGIVLHVFIVEEHNADLIQLAKQTGGVALQGL
jgi:Mg-chelatase subunit ChlD